MRIQVKRFTCRCEISSLFHDKMFYSYGPYCVHHARITCIAVHVSLLYWNEGERVPADYSLINRGPNE